MRLQLQYLTFSRGALFSKVSACSHPKALKPLTSLTVLVKHNGKACFNSSVLLACTLLLVSGQYPKFFKLDKRLKPFKPEYIVTLRKQSLYTFLDKVINLMLTQSSIFLRVYLGSKRTLLRKYTQLFSLYITNIYFFPEVSLLLGRAFNKRSILRFFKCNLRLKFAGPLSLRFKLNVLRSLQVPIIST